MLLVAMNVFANSATFSKSAYTKDIWRGFDKDTGLFDDKHVFKTIQFVRRGGFHHYIDHCIRDGADIVRLRTDKNNHGKITWKFCRTEIEDDVGVPFRMREFDESDGNQGPTVRDFKKCGREHGGTGTYKLWGANCGDYAGTQIDGEHWDKYPSKHTVILKPWLTLKWLPSSETNSQVCPISKAPLL
ncbi:unnamed protein product [Symbiodinium microadriaticum]|nr:unnamed protein product [Symbiodinium sp. KB8]CAE7678096.1 unnamed protein product [Symbiodinium microadriaticum]